MNCVTCKNRSSTCGYFPELSKWTGNLSCCEPRHWEKNNQSAAREASAEKPAKTVNFFTYNVTFEEKSEKNLELVCANSVCSKKSWCSDEIAQKCQYFVLPQEQAVIDHSHYQEVIYGTDM